MVLILNEGLTPKNEDTKPTLILPFLCKSAKTVPKCESESGKFDKLRIYVYGSTRRGQVHCLWQVAHCPIFGLILKRCFLASLFNINFEKSNIEILVTTLLCSDLCRQS